MENSALSLEGRWDTWIYEDHEELALICAHQAHATANNRVAAELWRTAKKYQAEAAKLDSRRLGNIGEPPPGPGIAERLIHFHAAGELLPVGIARSSAHNSNAARK